MNYNQKSKDNLEEIVRIEDTAIKYRKSKTLKNLVHCFVNGYISFRVADNIHFRSLLKMIPEFDIRKETRKRITYWIKNHVDTLHEKFKE